MFSSQTPFWRRQFCGDLSNSIHNSRLSPQELRVPYLSSRCLIFKVLVAVSCDSFTIISCLSPIVNTFSQSFFTLLLLCMFMLFPTLKQGIITTYISLFSAFPPFLPKKSFLLPLFILPHFLAYIRHFFACSTLCIKQFMFFIGFSTRFFSIIFTILSLHEVS